jgi:hypothetical protein
MIFIYGTDLWIDIVFGPLGTLVFSRGPAQPVVVLAEIRQFEK